MMRLFHKEFIGLLNTICNRCPILKSHWYEFRFKVNVPKIMLKIMNGMICLQVIKLRCSLVAIWPNQDACYAITASKIKSWKQTFCFRFYSCWIGHCTDDHRPHCRHGGGEPGGWGGEGGASHPDEDDGEDDTGAASLGGQGPHYRLPPVHWDGQQRKHRARDAQVGDEVVEGAVHWAEYPISGQIEFKIVKSLPRWCRISRAAISS